MKISFFASFIALCLLIMYEIRKNRKKEADTYQKFWDRESKANSTRRKSLEDLAYISIPLQSLPLSCMQEDEQICEYQQTIKDLSGEPIVNLTSITNTELKLRYGAANLDLLSLYDQRYTILVRTLDRWAAYLYQNHHLPEAEALLDYALSTNSDILSTYELITKIYEDTGRFDEISTLFSHAESLSELSKKRVTRFLKEHLSHT